jgi:hypothetical protein
VGRLGGGDRRRIPLTLHDGGRFDANPRAGVLAVVDDEVLVIESELAVPAVVVVVQNGRVRDS